MRYLTAICLSAVVSTAVVSTAKAQGESDPGLTQVGAMRTGAATIVTEDEYEHQKPQFSVGNTFSRGERGVRYNIPQLEILAPVGLEEGSGVGGYFNIRIPFVSANGELGHRWGLGDVDATYTHILRADPESWTVQATGGFQFGMTTSNLSDGHSRPLPMAYQSSLGSTDAMAGINFSWKQYLSIAAGYQQAIFRYNDNDYSRSSYYNDPVYSNTNYTVGRKLYRYGDAMMRVEGHLIGNRFGATLGALGLYHVHNDLYEDRFKGWQTIEDSRGLTVSGVGNLFVRFGRYGNCKFDVTASLPFYNRAIRPDGLQRDWTLTPRFTFYFKQRTLLF